MEETPTQTLHRLTSYEPGREWDEAVADPRIVQDLIPTNLDKRTWFYKRYPGDLPRTMLPREFPATHTATLSVLAGQEAIPQKDPDLTQLSRLLHLSAGVVRTGQRAYGTYLFRAAGSAGGRFPLELYVAVPEGRRIPAGVHWYHPEDHVLVKVGPPPRRGAVTVVVTGVPWRTGWRYRERGYRHVYWDAGTMLAQLIAAACSGGITPSLVTLFPDREVSNLVGADGVHEWPVALVTLESGSPALVPVASGAPGQVDADPIGFPLATAAQRAGDRDAIGGPWDIGDAVQIDAVTSPPVEEVVLRKGSLRRMDPSKGLSLELLRSSMAVAMRGVHIPHFVVVHSVEGLEPGVYKWPDTAEPTRAGELRNELYDVCLEQGLARDAAFVVIAAADIAQLDDRGYRDAQLAAGLVEGRLHLAAYALGAGASGMTFRDSDIRDLLREPLDGLLFTCVGVPEYKAAAGGMPGAPRAVRTPDPRL